jgi:hypothetical protein
MKYYNYGNKELLLLLTYFLLFIEIKSIKKSFMDLASQEVFKKEDYESESYRKEAASLNPEYYTPKGAEELAKCRNTFSANYDRCSRFKTCNFCAANSDCGWCNEKKLCIPIELNSRNDMLVPVCQGDCIRVLKIEYCYKGLFEPENTQGEINFGNYPHVKEESNKIEAENFDNIFEKALEKNYLEQRNHNLRQNSDSNSNSNISTFNFKEKKFMKSNSYSNFNSKNSHTQQDPNCIDPNKDLDSPADDLSENLKFSKNHNSLNYIPNAYTNKPLSFDLDTHHQRLVKDLTDISKNVFSKLIGEKVKAPSVNLLKPNFKSKKEKKEEMMEYLKEYVPNFEFPQFVKSDLEGAIDKIKKEKLLLWLRGYSLNEPISKQHLPIYKNLTFVNEDQARKLFLDKFYKDIVKDPYKDTNSKVYKNFIGEQTLAGENINDNQIKRNKGYLVPITSTKGNGDVKIISMENMPQKMRDILKKLQPQIEDKIDMFKGKTPLEVIKSLKVINSKFIDQNSLKSLVKQNNMRFKQNEKISDKKKIHPHAKSLKEISQELKDYLKTMK